MVDTRTLNDRDDVILQVMDAVDDSLIAQHKLKVSDFFVYGTRTFTDLGPVRHRDDSGDRIGVPFEHVE